MQFRHNHRRGTLQLNISWLKGNPIGFQLPAELIRHQVTVIMASEVLSPHLPQREMDALLVNGSPFSLSRGDEIQPYIRPDQPALTLANGSLKQNTAL